MKASYKYFTISTYMCTIIIIFKCMYVFKTMRRCQFPITVEMNNNFLLASLSAGSLIDCFKPLNIFDFDFGPKNHCLFVFDYFFQCIPDCLRKGHNSAKSDCLVSTKNVACFRYLEQLSRVPTTNDQYLLRGQR